MDNLTDREIDEIAKYTIHKIESFPPDLGITVDNYFDILMPREINNYMASREFMNRSKELLSIKEA